MCITAGQEAIDFIHSGAPADIMLLDINMPIKSGMDVMRDCSDHPPAFPVVRPNIHPHPTSPHLPPPPPSHTPHLGSVKEDRRSSDSLGLLHCMFLVA